MAGTPGIVASGHELTSAAAVEVLAAGGNAFDAALGGLCAACVCEPLLTSLGGGGYMLAQPAGQDSVLFDFFVQTPHRKRHESELDFFPILADFGTDIQEFHVGLASMAVPGNVAGLFVAHKALGRLPIAEVMAPAIELARNGVEISTFQHAVSTILKTILNSSPAAMRLVATDGQPDRIAAPGEVVRNADLAESLERLARLGPSDFYSGEVARKMVSDCVSGGGMLSLEDLASYHVITRQPVRVRSHGAEFHFNPPPSPGGTLLAFALAMLDPVDFDHDAWGSPHHAEAIAAAIQAGNLLRRKEQLDAALSDEDALRVLDKEHLEGWRQQAMPGALFSRGTTQLSVVDGEGNMVSMTTSNGEGSGYVIPGSGIMINNMLGEEDLNPGGFHRWPEDQRLASMMCPTLATLADGSRLALGSGGSNRIRSAVLQVLVNVFGLGLPLDQAVTAARIHLERDYLSMEEGYSEPTEDLLKTAWPEHRIWPGLNMFFGGVHAVEQLAGGEFRGMGDPRRGGAVAENR